jgi:hypothetical protein
MTQRTPHSLRAGNSGPVFDGYPGDVLTSRGNGQSVFAVGSSGAQVAVTASTPLTELDYDGVRSFLVTLDASTLFAIAWPDLPRVVILRIIQGGTGSHVPMFGPEVKFTGSVVPTWTAAPGHWDELAIDWDGTTATVSYGLNYGP